MRKLMLVFAALAVAACGDDDDMDTRVPDSAGGDVAAASDVRGTFIIGLSEWKVDSPMDTLPAGKYTFRIENSGTTEHGLEIEGNGKEWETGDLKPGTASELTVELTPGTYELYCPVEKGSVEHDDKGMKRTLVVRAS
jgi:plastocyanin